MRQNNQTTNETVAATDPAQVQAQLHHLATLIVTLAPDDLAGLASVHSGFQALADASHKSSSRLAYRGVELISQVMLREHDDPVGALAEAGRIITDIQNILDGNATAPAVPVHVATPTPSEGHERIADEPVFGEADLQLVHDFIGEATSHLDAAEAELLKLDKNPGDADAVGAVFRSFHTIKGVAGFLNLKQIGALAHASESLLDLARHGKLEISGATANLVLEAADTLRALVQSLGQSVAQGLAAPIQPVLPELIVRLKAAAEGKPPAQTGVPAPAPLSTPIEQSPRQDRRQGDRRASDSHGEASVKVATERLDALINMVGELVIAESMVSQNVVRIAAGNHRLLRDLAHLGKIARELQDLSMAMRMVPIQGAFQKMTRLVRDVAQKAGKEVELIITGGETELDRNVVEAISDPLVHMVRNSVDHGIESAADRERAGKAPTGRVELKAEHKAGNILIQISDDGRGLNKDRIVKKAIEAGVISEGQELSEQEIFRLIFHAGLSTAEKITDISGRGVGMDVVRRNIESLRGRIEISSTPGSGSTFSIRLPLTLAVIDGLLVRVGSERFILPITSVERSLRPSADQIGTVQERGEMCLVRGTLMPLFRLHRLFNIKPRTEVPAEGLVVIVRDNDRLCCVLVDELLGQQQVVIKSLGGAIGNVRGISGGAILGDGNVCLILDVPGIIDLASTH